MELREEYVIKIWGRNTSSNVQKVMWAIGEIGLPHERIDIGGAVRQEPRGRLSGDESRTGWCRRSKKKTASCCGNRIPSCAISPPSINRRVLEPADLRARALASKWMDWQLSVCGPAITPVFWGLIRTPPEKRDHAAIEAGKKKTTAAIADDGRAARQDRLSRRRCFLLRRYSRSASWPIATASWCPTGRR